MSAAVSVAIVGVENLAGEAVLAVLEDHEFSFAQVRLVDLETAAGGRLMIKGQSLKVEPLERFDFTEVQAVLFLGDPALTNDWADKASAAGCLVVDATGALRECPEVPLVVAGVNDEVLAGCARGAKVCAADSQVVQAALAVQPLLEAGLEALMLATYQSMSTQGQEALEALAMQTGRLLNGQPVEKGVFDKQIAFNLLARVGEPLDNGSTLSEQQFAEDLRRVLDLPQLLVSITCVLVPLFYGNAQVLQVQTREALELKRINSAIRKLDGLKLLDKPAAGGFPTPVTDATGSDQVWVGRLRTDSGDSRRINMWTVSDNLRKGVALNSLQTVELLIKGLL